MDEIQQVNQENDYQNEHKLKFKDIEYYLKDKEFGKIVEECQKYKQSYREYTKMKWQNVVYEVGNFAIVQNSQLSSNRKNQSVCQIKAIYGILGFEDKELPLVEVQYYLNKYDVLDKNIKYDRVFSVFEVFQTDNKEIILVDQIVGTCKVISLEEFESNQHTQIRQVFFTRASYDNKNNKFNPPIETWKKSCICQMPYNPDSPYIQCDQCDNWLHQECAGITQQEAEHIEKYFCIQCQSK